MLAANMVCGTWRSRESTALGEITAGEITAGGRPCLALTGERTVPGIPEENYWFRRHEAAYLALLPYCARRHGAGGGLR